MRIIRVTAVFFFLGCGAPPSGSIQTQPKASCNDSVRNGSETDIDCGGKDCNKCVVNKACKNYGDCEERVCRDGVCQASMCANGKLDGDETDIDCGGRVCPGCDYYKECWSYRDCLSLACDAGQSKCVPAYCMDGVKNPNEASLDCGGPCLKRCAVGQHCFGDGKRGWDKEFDCVSAVCVNFMCQAPACDDEVKNGLETDVDCGRSADTGCTGCAIGKACREHSDCLSGKCDQLVCVN
jgi:hypothetical protein